MPLLDIVVKRNIDMKKQNIIYYDDVWLKKIEDLLLKNYIKKLLNYDRR